MKLLLYECKKVWDAKLFLLLMVFTFLFYNMFMVVTIHPGDSASCEAQNALASALKETYGMSLAFEDFGVLEELRQEQIAALDALVKESSVLQEVGITSYKQLRALDDKAFGELESAINQEYNRIVFEDGIQYVFLKQEIEHIYEMEEWFSLYSAEEGKESESADKYLRSHWGGGYTKTAVKRVADVIKENSRTLIPENILFHLEREDFSKFGILLILSCLVLILPYQIKEGLAGVNPLAATTNTGRNIWNRRYLAVLVSCFAVCVIQFVIFCAVLKKSGILQYWEYPLNGNSQYFYWLDMTFGTYLLLKTALYGLLALCTTAVFYFISRIASNYVAGVAIGAPTAALIGILTVGMTGEFLAVTKSVGYNLLRPIGFGVLLFLTAVLVLYVMNRNDRRKDILV